MRILLGFGQTFSGSAFFYKEGVLTVQTGFHLHCKKLLLILWGEVKRVRGSY